MDARQHGQMVSFTRYFYKPQQLPTLAEIETDIRALEAQTEEPLKAILVEPAPVVTWGRS